LHYIFGSIYDDIYVSIIYVSNFAYLDSMPIIVMVQ